MWQQPGYAGSAGAMGQSTSPRGTGVLEGERTTTTKLAQKLSNARGRIRQRGGLMCFDLVSLIAVPAAPLPTADRNLVLGSARRDVHAHADRLPTWTNALHVVSHASVDAGATDER